MTSFRLFFFLTFVLYLISDWLPASYPPAARFSLIVSIFVEFILIMILIRVWIYKQKNYTYGWIYLFAMIFFFRCFYHMAALVPEAWGVRMAWIHSPLYGLVFYGMGLLMLHPEAYDTIRERVIYYHNELRHHTLYAALLSLLFAGMIFYALGSVHITRDGMDWIERSTKPVWHLYMREPLTIGLYRLAFCIAQPFFDVRTPMMVSYRILPWFAILSGVWGLYWLGRWIGEKWRDGWDRVLALGLALSTGGWMLLYFGHVEVYPTLLAGWLPLFYYCEKYLRTPNVIKSDDSEATPNSLHCHYGEVRDQRTTWQSEHNGKNKGSIITIALWFSISFVLHLSTGWLLPAMLLLPFFAQRKKALGELTWFISIFFLFQCFFWGGLWMFYYDMNLPAMAARLYETFHVGPDRAMFERFSSLFEASRLWGLVNEAIYLSISCLWLLPFFIISLMKKRKPQDWFWVVAFVSYGVYVFLWNPDRGFPEDWDLFSPFAPIAVFTILTIVFSSERENSTVRREWLYITVIAAMPLAMAQILFHHWITFSRAGL